MPFNTEHLSESETKIHESEQPEQLTAILTQKVEEAIRRLLRKQIEDYYDQHISQEDLAAGAEQIFTLILKGEAQEEVDREILTLSRRLAENI